ncbi:hypothetical protein QQF64_005119 [Cirrhinus molitorella]|uniref:Uncharacterized protein n=1 Tax=Cirrhinus molitorella TaxID=172907 RepID=A0ABR3MKE6_9TELE
MWCPSAPMSLERASGSGWSCNGFMEEGEDCVFDGVWQQCSTCACLCDSCYSAVQTPPHAHGSTWALLAFSPRVPQTKACLDLPSDKPHTHASQMNLRTHADSWNI